MRSSPYLLCACWAGARSVHGDGSARRQGALARNPNPNPNPNTNPNTNPNPNPNQVRGELTLVLAPLGAEAREAREAARQLSLTEQVDAALRARLAAGEPVSSTAKQVAVELGVHKKAVYARALQISKASPEAAAGDANGPEGIEGIHF